MTEKKIDVAALGELIIDFICNGTSPQGNPLYEANPGGAPCNVLAMLAKLGRRTAFIGKVGDDQFGHLLLRAGREAGIDMGSLVLDGCTPTTLAFVKTAENGDRNFSFYRDPGADMRLTPEEVRAETIAAARIFHFGSLRQSHSPYKEGSLHAEGRLAGGISS